MMHTRKPWPVLFLLFALLVSGFGATPARVFAATLPLVDDFEAALDSGVDPNGIPVGWFNAQDGGSTVSFSRMDAPPAPRPGASAGNNVLQTTMNVTAFGTAPVCSTRPAVNPAQIPLLGALTDNGGPTQTHPCSPVARRSTWLRQRRLRACGVVQAGSDGGRRTEGKACPAFVLRLRSSVRPPDA